MQPCRVLVRLVASAVVLTACGGGDDPEPTTTGVAPEVSIVAADEWRDVVEQGCADWNEDFSHLEGARPATAAEALQHTEDVRDLAEGLAGVIGDAGLPEGADDDARRLVERSQEMAQAARDLATAASAGDGDGIDEATAQVDALGEELNELAEQLDVPACGGY